MTHARQGSVFSGNDKIKECSHTQARGYMRRLGACVREQESCKVRSEAHTHPKDVRLVAVECRDARLLVDHPHCTAPGAHKEGS